MIERHASAPGTVAIVLIGDEILSGSIQDKNSDYIIHALSPLGYEVGEIRVIPDNVERIGATVRELAGRFEVVITSGGVGPTHDDVTFEGIASGFGVERTLSDEVRAFLDERYGSRINESIEGMAYLPTGSKVLLKEVGSPWPIILYRNVFILPGLPRAMRDKIDRIAGVLPPLGEFRSAEVYLTASESDYVTWLNSFQQRHASVAVGSYPYWDEPEFKTKITVRGRDHNAVEEALAELLQFVEKNEWLVRTHVVDVDPAPR